jgi:hypothetical protein
LRRRRRTSPSSAAARRARDRRTAGDGHRQQLHQASRRIRAARPRRREPGPYRQRRARRAGPARDGRREAARHGRRWRHEARGRLVRPSCRSSRRTVRGAIPPTRCTRSWPERRGTRSSALTSRNTTTTAASQSIPVIRSRDPLSTISTKGPHQALVTSNLVKLRGTCADGQPVDEPLHTVSAGGSHFAEVRAFLLKYYGADQDPRLEEPLHTVTSKDRFGLVIVTVEGEEYAIVDIGMRMLTKREQFNAQGFPPDYIIDRDSEGRPITEDGAAGQVRQQRLPADRARDCGGERAECGCGRAGKAWPHERQNRSSP